MLHITSETGLRAAGEPVKGVPRVCARAAGAGAAGAPRARTEGCQARPRAEPHAPL